VVFINYIYISILITKIWFELTLKESNFSLLLRAINDAPGSLNWKATDDRRASAARQGTNIKFHGLLIKIAQNHSSSNMSAGFSAGGFIASLELIGTVINALRESGELINQLYSPKAALLQVKQLELGEEQRSEYIALRQSASQCQRMIDSFWKKIQKYPMHLKTGGSTSKMKDSWMKVR
jgi:hypothetical protein